MAKQFSSRMLIIISIVSIIIITLGAALVFAVASNPGGGGGSQTGAKQELNVNMVPPEVFEYTSVFSMNEYKQKTRYGTAKEGSFELKSSQSRYKNTMTGVVTVRNLDYLENYGEIYEAWMVDMDTGFTLPIGLFTVDGDGDATVTFTNQDYAIPYDAIAITKESYPDEDPRPNGDVVLVGYFDASSLDKSTLSSARISKEEYSQYGNQAETVYG
ncbi:anti-sigma factor [Candidatus Woesearchaeota archaeon]|nr:anti-sigma factor [Candidatus Woesearchaeota archaeon]